MAQQANLTTLLHRAVGGDGDAFGGIFETLYPELRRLAHFQLRNGSGEDLLNTTVLVHEVFLRFSNAKQVNIVDRGHFMRYVGSVMRSVVVDMVRERQSARRGGGVEHLALDTNVVANPVGEAEVLQVHEALGELQALDERMVRVVEMRYFAGLTEVEIAQALGITDRTVRRVWERARIWLAEALAS